MRDLVGNEFPLIEENGQLISYWAIELPQQSWTAEEQRRHDEYIAHSVLDEAQAMIAEYKMHESALVVTGLPDVKAAAQHRQLQFATREATLRDSVQDLRARIESLVAEGSSLLSSEEFPSWNTGRGTEVVLLGEDGGESSAPDASRVHAELKDMQQGDWHARENATGDTASAPTCSMGTSGEETSDTVTAAAPSRGGDPTVTPLRRLSVEQEVDMSVMAGKREPVQSSSSAMDAKQRAALPLATWVVDAWISDSESPDRFGFKYYLRFVCIATGKRRTYGCLSKKSFTEALRLHVRWVRSIAHLTERHHGFATGTLDIRVLASDMDSSMGTIKGSVRSAFDELVVARGLLRWITTKGTVI